MFVNTWELQERWRNRDVPKTPEIWPHNLRIHCPHNTRNMITEQENPLFQHLTSIIYCISTICCFHYYRLLFCPMFTDTLCCTKLKVIVLKWHHACDVLPTHEATLFWDAWDSTSALLLLQESLLSRQSSLKGYGVEALFHFQQIIFRIKSPLFKGRQDQYIDTLS